jgi:hypothetical protein
MPNRGHALTIDSGWREVAQTALDFVEKSLHGDVNLNETAQMNGEGNRPRLQSTV